MGPYTFPYDRELVGVIKERNMVASLSARHWIGGDWVDSATRLVSINPATGETIGTYAEAGEAEAKQAVKVARQAFLETDWRGNRRLRAKALNEMADRFEARTDDLVAILCLENGKIESEARFEVSMVPSKLRFYAALALTEFGRAIETAPGHYSMTLREPVGVAGIIAPGIRPSSCLSDHSPLLSRPAAPLSASCPDSRLRPMRGCAKSLQR